MQKISDWWHYWRENINTAKSGYDMGCLILSIVLIVVSPLMQPVNPLVADIVRWSGMVLAAAWCLLWLPFIRHQTNQVDFIVKKSKLLEENEELKGRLKERAEKLVNKSILGAFLDRLEQRTRSLERMTQTNYRDGLKDGEDLESLELVGHIKSFITKNIGAGEAAAFSSLAGIKLTTFNTPLDWGVLHDLEEARRKQIHMIDHLNHWAAQLKEIINNYK